LLHMPPRLGARVARFAVLGNDDIDIGQALIKQLPFGVPVDLAAAYAERLAKAATGDLLQFELREWVDYVDAIEPAVWQARSSQLTAAWLKTRALIYGYFAAPPGDLRITLRDAVTSLEESVRLSDPGARFTPARAKRLLALLDPGRHDARQLLLDAALAGDAEAQRLLAVRAAESGDCKSAAAWFSSLLWKSNHSPEVPYDYAMTMMRGPCRTADRRRAIELLSASAEGGVPSAMFELGVQMATGAPPAAGANVWIERAASFGHPGAIELVRESQ
ncbi:MAG TPA: hypothetical protein VNN25_27150, partial [Thermoanaerobaculia bacterium]|nr:hypothetical protein [Thermoanaerobaculia bacterium]